MKPSEQSRTGGTVKNSDKAGRPSLRCNRPRRPRSLEDGLPACRTASSEVKQQRRPRLAQHLVRGPPADGEKLRVAGGLIVVGALSRGDFPAPPPRCWIDEQWQATVGATPGSP